METERVGYFWAFLSAALLGASYIFFFILLPRLSIGTVTFYIFLIGLLFALVSRVSHFRLYAGKVRENAFPLLVMGICQGVGTLLFLASMRALLPSTVAFLMQFVLIFVVLYSHFFLKERFNKTETVGIVVSLAGALILQWNQRVSFALTALGAAFLFATADFISKKYIQQIEPPTLNLMRLFSNAVTGLIYLLATQESFTISLTDFVIAGAAGLLCAFLGWELFFNSLSQIALAKANTIRTAAPIFTAAYAYILFGHLFTLMQSIGSLLIITGILFLIQGMRHKLK